MFRRLIIVMLSVIALGGGGMSCALAGSFIFIEQKPPATSEDRTTKSASVYLTEKGLGQRYACEDYQIKELNESSLPVAGLFQQLAGIALKSLPDKQDAADAGLPPSQAQPGHIRIMVRQSNGAEYLWTGAANAVPSALQKLVQEALVLVAELKTAGPSAGDFVRADVLSADRLAEYRVGNLLKTVKDSGDLDPVLKQSLTNPFRLIPVPAGTNPLSDFSVKGEASPLPLLYDETGYEIIRYSFSPQ